MSPRSTPKSDSDALVCLLAKVLAPLLQERLHPCTVVASDYYHQGDSPLGKRRHLELVRRGVLTGHKVGRCVFVLRDEVRAYIDGCARRRPPVESKIDDLLSEWGLKRVGSK